MKKLITILILLCAMPVYASELVNGVSAEIVCPMTTISNGSDLTSGTVNLRVQKINTGDGEDGYYLTTSNTWQAAAADLPLTYRYGNIWTRNITSNYSGQLRLSCVDTTPSTYRISWSQTVYPANRFNDTTDTVTLADASLSEAKYAANENPAELILATPSQKLVTDASGHVTVAAGSKTGYSLAADQSGVTVGTVNALAPIATGTEDNTKASTQFKVFTTGTALANNTRRYLGMCLEIDSTKERSRIIGYGVETSINYFTVRGFSGAVGNGATLNIYPDGCQ